MFRRGSSLTFRGKDYQGSSSSSRSKEDQRKNAVATSEPFRIIAAEFGYCSVGNCVTNALTNKQNLNKKSNTNPNDSDKWEKTTTPCFTNQFVFNVLHRFANGQRCVAIATQSNEKNIAHVMTQSEMAEWLGRRLELLGESVGKPLFKMTSMVRRPFTINFQETAKEAFTLMTTHRCDALAIVNDSEVFVDEIKIEDIRWVARERETPDEAEIAKAMLNSNLSPNMRGRGLALSVRSRAPRWINGLWRS